MAAIDHLNIAFLSTQDPLSGKTWSGTTFSMYRALQSRCGSVIPLGPAPVGQFGGKLFNRAVSVVGRRYDYSHSISYAKRCARFFERQLDGKGFDLIFAPAASSGIAFLKTDIPIVYASDATFALLQDYYPEFSGLLGVSRRQGNMIEQAALSRCRLALFSSEWAARSAIERYRTPCDRVAIVPFGANMERVPPREAIRRRPLRGRVRMLFLAVDWRRKGGDIALETLASLIRRGIDAELTVCGCVPPSGVSHPAMNVTPFLSKDDPEQMGALSELFLASDLLLLPTRYDCTPVVICEANAFGMPVVTTDTGGVSSLIRQGENGMLLPLAAHGDSYADAIVKLCREGEGYEAMCRSSRTMFENLLNWKSWALEVGELLADAVSGGLLRHASGW